MADKPINVWYSDGVRYEDYRRSDGTIETIKTAVTNLPEPNPYLNVYLQECDECGCWTGGSDCPYCTDAPHPRGR